MSDDIKKLSEQFLDLWQRQISATMKNPEAVGSMMEMLKVFQQNMGQTIGQTMGKFDSSNLNFGNLYGMAENAKTNAADPSVSKPGNDELHELSRRLDACEKRLDQLESGTKGKGRKSTRKSG